MRTCFILILIFCNCAQAFNLSHWFSTPDQRAYKLMQQGKFQKAQKEFESSDWQGVASYRAGNYNQAGQMFASLNTAQGYYNQGNALALSGKYEDAISAYNKALVLDPKNKDAEFNRDLLKKLQQQKQQQRENKEQQKSNNSNKDSNQQKQQTEKQQQQNSKKNEKSKNSNQNHPQDNEQQSKQRSNALKKSAQKNTNKNQNDEQTQEQKTAAREKERAKEQWLKLIPDDPGGLLREKFWRDHLRRQEGWNL